jgi:hypothetical protein
VPLAEPDVPEPSPGLVPDEVVAPAVPVVLPAVVPVVPVAPMPVLLVLLPGFVAVVDGAVVELDAPMLVPVLEVELDVRAVDWHPAASAATTTRLNKVTGRWIMVFPFS